MKVVYTALFALLAFSLPLVAQHEEERHAAPPERGPGAFHGTPKPAAPAK